MALETSLARAELLRLTWEMIHDNEGVIVSTSGRKKTGVDQLAPLTEKCREMLAFIKAECKAANITNLATTDLVFVREYDRPTDGGMVVGYLKPACTRAEVKGFTFHDTRHTAVSRWAKRGISSDAATAARGHTSYQMHQRYRHLQRRDVDEIFGTSKKSYQGFKTEQKAVNSSDSER